MNCLISIADRICIAAYWILYSEFGLVSCIDLFFDVSDGQFRCKINRTSSKFTAFNLNTVERSEDLSNDNLLAEFHIISIPKFEHFQRLHGTILLNIM